ncbi:hypothetical protein M9434_005433 [Picochlorum sp. BPE23]|nr:hypothetical protein M9434_005433 [Picochlorum sp. BPE23]
MISRTLSFVGCPELYSRHMRCRSGRCHSQPFSDGEFGKGRDSAANRLEGIIKRKKEKIQAYLDEIGVEELENRLQDALKIGAGPTPFAFSQKVAEVGMVEGRPLLIFEVGRSEGEGESAESAEKVAERAARLVQAGADALSVRVDEEVTPEGDKDAFVVCQACRSVPVFYRDWLLHPVQLVNAKSTGCSGVLGIVASVSGPKGTPVMSSFGSALGLDSPVEVVNLAEMKMMAEASVPFYCMDIGVSLSLSGIAGFGSDVVQGVLGEMPFGSLSIVGLRDIEKARSVRAAGADGLYIRREIVDMYKGDEASLVSHIKSLVDGD